MEKYITITSRGQATIPVLIRRKLGVSQAGGKISIRFDEEKGEAVLAKKVSVRELAGLMSRYIKPGTPPLIDVHGYYQKHRRATAQGVE